MSLDKATWRGEWIWTPEVDVIASPSRFGGYSQGASDEAIVMFRREFTLDAKAKSALLRVASNSRHFVYVNGREVLRGPIRSQARKLFYDILDISGDLVVGKNCLAVLVRRYGFATAWWEPTPLTGPGGAGGLVCEAEIILNSDSAEPKFVLTSNDTWQTRRSDAWAPASPTDEISAQIPEIFTAQRLDPAWTSPGFDDSLWSRAEVSTVRQFGRPGNARPPAEPFGVLRANPLPHPQPQVRKPTSIQIVPSKSTAGDGVSILREILEGAASGLDSSSPFSAESHPNVERQHSVSNQPPLLVSGGCAAILDFGGIVSGVVSFRLNAEPEARVVVSLLESLDPSSIDSANHIDYSARGELDSYASLEFMGGRYALLVVIDERDIELTDFIVTEFVRPRPEGLGFHCDDDALNTLHAVALRTVDLCSRDAYLDCPTREQRAWVGDSVIHQSVELTNNANWSLAIRNTQLLAAPRQDGLLPMVAAADFANPGMVAIPDACLHWTRTVYNLYRYTGDRALVAELMPAFESVVRWFLPFQGDDGVLHDVTGWVLIDWAPTEVDGAVASLNGLWARALLDFAEISAWLGDEGRAAWADTVHAEVTAGFEQFWDPDRNHYVDSIQAGVRSRRLSEHAHAAAVVGGLVPGARHLRLAEILLDRQRVVDPSMLLAEYNPATYFRETLELRYQPNWDVENELLAAQPFFRYVVHDALAILGRAESLPGLLHDWDALMEIGPSALREVWRGQSYAHGWSATPARDLILHIAGISPAEPGFTSVRVAPRLGTLRAIEVTAPTPHGPVAVQVKDGTLTIASPRPVVLVHEDGTVSDVSAGRTSVAWRSAPRPAETEPP